MAIFGQKTPNLQSCPVKVSKDVGNRIFAKIQYMVAMKNSFLAHEDWSSLSPEPSGSGSSTIHFVLTYSPSPQTSSRWFPWFLGFRTFFAGQ
jgi:hypothetical protein